MHILNSIHAKAAVHQPPALLIDFTLPFTLHSRSLEPEIEASDATE